MSVYIRCGLQGSPCISAKPVIVTLLALARHSWEGGGRGLTV